MTFRRATLEDVPTLLTLQEQFYAGEGYPYDRMKMERGMRELIANPTFGRLFFEPTGAYLVLSFGFSLEFGGRDAFVDELYVAEQARGRGLGTEALRLAEDACREAGIGALHLEVEHVNDRARALYQRNGYKAHERHLMTKWV